MSTKKIQKVSFNKVNIFEQNSSHAALSLRYRSIRVV